MTCPWSDEGPPPGEIQVKVASQVNGVCRMFCCGAEIDKSMQKVCPAGTIVASKLIDPMSDSSSRLEHCERCDHEVSAALR